jgi:hypothetical protein
MKKTETKVGSERVLQIKNLDPDIIRQLEIYEINHDHMTHAQVFTKAFLALLASEQEK